MNQKVKIIFCVIFHFNINVYLIIAIIYYLALIFLSNLVLSIKYNVTFLNKYLLCYFTSKTFSMSVVPFLYHYEDFQGHNGWFLLHLIKYRNITWKPKLNNNDILDIYCINNNLFGSKR